MEPTCLNNSSGIICHWAPLLLGASILSMGTAPGGHSHNNFLHLSDLVIPVISSFVSNSFLYITLVQFLE